LTRTYFKILKNIKKSKKSKKNLKNNEVTRNSLFMAVNDLNGIRKK